MTLSEAKLQISQFLASRCPFDLEESPVADSKRVASIEVLASDLEGKAD